MTTERRAVSSSDNYRVEHLRDALAHDPATTELDVQISLAGERLVLTGYAGTEAHRQAITDVSRRILPDVEIVNEMDLTEFGAGGEPESLS